MSGRCDLLVLGAGPAGSALAVLAARAGARVVLVERDRFPRDKVCGEFVSAEGCAVLERLGVLEPLASSGATWMNSCRVTDLGGAALDSSLPRLDAGGREALGVSRSRLDESLLARAAECGAEIRQRWEAVEPRIETGRVRGFRLRAVGSGGSGETLRAPVVVAADGRRSLLARTLHPRLCDPARSGPASWFGIKTHVAARPAGLRGRVELHLFPGGYAGMGEVEEGRINVCALVTVGALRECGGSPDRVLRERILSNPAARESIGTGAGNSRWKAVGPLRFGPRRAAAAGALFVGDAAGTIDPFCGEGISNALRGAELALPYALRGVERGGIDDALAGEYERVWRAAFGPVTRRVRRLGWLFERPRLAGAMLRLLRGPGRGLTPRLVASTRTGV